MLRIEVGEIIAKFDIKIIAKFDIEIIAKFDIEIIAKFDISGRDANRDRGDTFLTPLLMWMPIRLCKEH